MKKEVSAWDKKITALMFRWRWVMTGLVGVQVVDLAHRYKVHDVIGFPWLPSTWVLPWLTFCCIGPCVLAVMVWVAYLYKPRLNG